MRDAFTTGFTRLGIERAYGSRFIDGNNVELLSSGRETFGRIFEAVAGARKSIYLQFYIYRNDETGTELAELLRRKAREGVSVHVLYDHLGSWGTPRGFWDSLRADGIRVSASYPFIWYSPRRNVYRDHRKVIIVDGSLAFTGGLNIANEYRGGFFTRKLEPWRDTGIVIEGPAVLALADTFVRAWKRWAHERIAHQTPKAVPAGNLPLIPIFAHTGRGRRRIRRLLHYGINRAVSEICLTTAYFTPSFRMFLALRSAVRRGVRVMLILPGHSDVAAAHYAGRASFTRLLKAGVEIYAYQGSMLHAKTYVFDSHWSVVGSANLDYRSLKWNDEGNVGIFDRAFALKMRALFEQDIHSADRITLEEWVKRPLIEKLKERLFSLLRHKL